MTFNYELDFIRHRYDRLASIYPVSNLVFGSRRAFGPER